MTRIANQDFTLTRDDCRPLSFRVGDEIPVEHESHGWVLRHTDEVAVESGVEVAISLEKRKPGRPAKT